LLLYYITDRTQFAGDEPARRQRLFEKLAEAARLGVDYVQLREKDLAGRALESLAVEAAEALRPAADLSSLSGELRPRTRLLTNSRTDVAIACGADGVHLRSDDLSPSEVRAVWRQAKLVRAATIGVSCHSAEEVRHAASAGADFVVFGPVFEKNNFAASAGLKALSKACREKIPVLALGGISPENAKSCMEAGASGIAGIRLFQQAGMTQVVEVLRAIIRG
jgi:thiamine-phosphate pyrophosphorylase